MNFVIVLLIIMVITCNGRNKTFKQSHGLSRHRTSCIAAKEHTASLAHKRLKLQKEGNGSRKVLKDTGAKEQPQQVKENVCMI